MDADVFAKALRERAADFAREAADAQDSSNPIAMEVPLFSLGLFRRAPRHNDL